MADRAERGAQAVALVQDRVRLGPLTALGIHDASLAVLRQRPGALITLSAWGAVPLASLLLATLYLARGLPRQEVDISQGMALWGLSLLVVLLAFWRHLCMAAQAQAVFALVHGDPDRPATAWLAGALRRSASIMLASAFTLVLAAASGLLLFIPHIFLGGRLLPALPLAALGEARGLGALTSASALLQGARGRALGVNIIYYLLWAMVMVNLFLLPKVLLASVGSMAEVDVAYWDRFLSMDNGIYMALLAALAFVALDPLRAVSSALLLVNVKVCRQGMDLRVRVATILDAGGPDD